MAPRPRQPRLAKWRGDDRFGPQRWLHEHRLAGPSDGASTPHTPAPASDTSAFLAAEWRVGASSALGRAAAAMSLSPALKLRGHLSAVTCVDWHPAMAVIVSGALDGAIRMWQLSAWLRRRGSKQLVTHDIEPMRIYRGHSHPVTDLKVSSALVLVGYGCARRAMGDVRNSI